MTDTRPFVHEEPVNTARAFIIKDLLMSELGQQYNRYTPSAIFPLNKAFSLTVYALNFNANGAKLTMTGEHQVEVDGAVVATANGTGGVALVFAMPSSLPAGYREVVVIGPDGGRSMTHHMHMGTELVDTEIPLWTHTYDLLHNHGYVNRWCRIPTTAMRTPRAIEPHAITPFSEVPNPANLFSIDLVPDIGERLVSEQANTLTTAHAMAYPFGAMVAKFPRASAHDGPRGIGTLSFMAGAFIGKATQFADPSSARMGINYVWTLHRFCRLNPDGRLTTLFGWKTPSSRKPSYWDDGQDETKWEFVGDRSRIPMERRHFARAWDWVPDPRTTKPNPGGEQTEGDGRERHHGNVVMYVTVAHTCDLSKGVANMAEGAIWRVIWDGAHHGSVGIAEEVIHGLIDPFGMGFDEVRNELIVNERGRHRIIAINPDTGEITRVILQGQPLATVSAQNHTTSSTYTLAQRRAAPCVAPEGGRIMDRWWVFGSLQQQDMRRVNIDSSALEVLVQTEPPRNFMLVGVSDGTFGPDWSLLMGGFEAAMHGWPKYYPRNPDGSYGTRIYLSESGGDEPAVSHGRGSVFANRDYTGGFAVGDGQLVCGASKYGIKVLVKAVPSDRPRPSTTAEKAMLKQGQLDLERSLVISRSGESLFGYSPWGVSEAADAVLRWEGHVEPGTVIDPPAPPPPPPPPPAPEPPAPAPEPPPPPVAFATIRVPVADLIPGRQYKLVLDTE